MFKLVPRPKIPRSTARCFSPVKRPVARALCFDELSEPVTETFEFTTVPVTAKKRARKVASAKPMIQKEGDQSKSDEQPGYGNKIDRHLESMAEHQEHPSPDC